MTAAHPPDLVVHGWAAGTLVSFSGDGHRIATTGDVAAFSTVAERVFGERLPVVEAAALGAH